MMKENTLRQQRKSRTILFGKAAVVLTLFSLMAPFLEGQAPKSGSQPGPAVGQKIPFFRAPDQYGRMQDFNSLRGPNGAMIVFERSLDW